MTVDKNIESNLKYLDDILKHLVNYASHYTLTFDELYKCIYNRDLESDNKFNAIEHLIAVSEETDFFEISISDNQRALGEKLVEACYYLKQNGFILISPQFNIKITFSGILQYSNGFANHHQKQLETEKRFDELQESQKRQGWWMVALTFLITVGTIVSAWYYLTLIFCKNI